MRAGSRAPCIGTGTVVGRLLVEAAGVAQISREPIVPQKLVLLRATLSKSHFSAVGAREGILTS